MGKVRRLRKKYHLACQREETAKTETSTPILPVVQSLPERLGPVEVPLILDKGSNIFSGITISLSDLKQTLVPPTTRTTVLGSVSEASVVESARTDKNKPRRKKDFLADRRKKLLAKLEALEATRQAAKDAKKRKAPPKLPQPMSLLTLVDTLPSVTGICKDKKKTGTKTSTIGEKSTGTTQRHQTGIQKTSSPIKKTRQNAQKELLANMEKYKQVLSNKQYKTDPFSAISNYVRKTVSQDMSWQIK
ncbi:Vesicle-associated membrane protein-associated protein C16G5.05c [Frankliniella fusca]|uniref:Vesicle-associated membrane protein-associated protein C16G5.05c n=1 Tax=Frankliniella fusca TaxID=407009 RepID=A0AAE1GRT6_9NEOP|nr:Vesicle-associated membrane protein-associated protein C16G5.05c [Frankliniella fusca]